MPDLIFRVKLAQNDSIYFVIPARSHQAAKKVAREMLEGDWGDDPVFRAKKEPFHSTVGHRFRGPFGGTYRCTSYDSRTGFWMENEADPKDRRDVSERAPGRTYHRIYDDLG